MVLRRFLKDKILYFIYTTKNKRVTETKNKNWFRRHGILTGMLAFFAFFLIIGIFQGVSNGIVGENNSNKISSDFCSLQNLKTIIPDRIKCILEEDKCLTKTDEQQKTTWKDGIELKITSPFERGDQAGENVNYLYSGGRLFHSETPINSDGTISERVRYEIDLAIDSTDKTDEGYKVKQYCCCENVCYDKVYKNLVE